MAKKVDFRPVELEICKGACTMRQVVEVDARTTLSQLLDAARELLRKCGWQKVRVGVGSVWSNWIY
jgi:hypothetical protein